VGLSTTGMKKPPGQMAQEVSASTGRGARLSEKENARATAHYIHVPPNTWLMSSYKLRCLSAALFDPARSSVCLRSSTGGYRLDIGRFGTVEEVMLRPSPHSD
jgi:hypothetical protein